MVHATKTRCCGQMREHRVVEDMRIILSQYFMKLCCELTMKQGIRGLGYYCYLLKQNSF